MRNPTMDKNPPRREPGWGATVEQRRVVVLGGRDGPYAREVVVSLPLVSCLHGDRR